MREHSGSWFKTNGWQLEQHRSLPWTSDYFDGLSEFVDFIASLIIFTLLLLLTLLMETLGCSGLSLLDLPIDTLSA